MEMSGLVQEDRYDSLVAKVARCCSVPTGMIYPFADFGRCLTALFEFPKDHTRPIFAAGHVPPEVLLAADRASRTVEECLGASPFAADPECLIAQLATGSETVYLANPNRITGANFGLKELRMVADAVPNGLLLIDEQYFDYYSITARSLLGEYSNIAIIRSFTSAFSINSSTAGHLIAGEILLGQLTDLQPTASLSATLYRLLATTMDNGDARALRVKLLHDEALRVATTLTGLGMQCRISPTDFLLIRVSDPVRVGNELASRSIPIENLDGYPNLKHYVRYTLASEINNERLINAFRRMPEDFYKMGTLDGRLARLRAGSHRSVEQQVSEVSIIERNARPLIRESVSVGDSTIAAEETISAEETVR